MAREQAMGPHLSGHAHRLRPRRCRRARRQDRHRPCATLRENRIGMERATVKREISCFSIRAYCRFDCIFWGVVHRKLANRCAVFGYSNLNRVFTDVRGRALFIRCGVCGDSRDFVRIPDREDDETNG